MENIREKLGINPEQICQEITTLLVEKLDSMGKDGIVIGLSGGLDSAVAAYLAARSVGSDKLVLLNMPDRDSDIKHRRHARVIAEELGAPLQVKRLTLTLRAAGLYRSIPIIGFVPVQSLKRLVVGWGKKAVGLDQAENLLVERLHPKGGSLVARANAYITFKHRMRMVFLYHYARVYNLMVVGAANKTEVLTGTFTQWGCDQCADVMPIAHLYRSQLSTLAEYLGVPAVIRSKAADPDVLPGVNDKGQLLGSFEIADQILWGLENGISVDQLSDSFGEELVSRIRKLYSISKPMREVPYRLSNVS